MTQGAAAAMPSGSVAEASAASTPATHHFRCRSAMRQPALKVINKPSPYTMERTNAPGEKKIAPCRDQLTQGR